MATGHDLQESLKPNEKIFAIQIFRPLLIRMVKAGELISSPKIKKILGVESVKTLRCSKDCERTKVNMILDLMTESDDSTKWEILAEALTEVDFVFLPKIIVKEYSTDLETPLHMVLEGLKDDVIEEEKLKHLSGVIKDHSLISEQDVQDIETECYNRKSIAAVVVLIDRIVTSATENWFTEFLSCLIDAGMDEIVKKIKHQSKSLSMDDSPDSSDHSTSILQGLSRDDYWRKLIMELCREHIVNNVTPSDLLGNLTILTKEEKREIRMVEDVSPLTAMTRLLETLDQKENIPGKWQAFKDALRENGFEWIDDLIEGNFAICNENEKWENIISLFERRLSEQINPLEILPLLTRLMLISDIDAQAVQQMVRNHGETRAVFRLLTCLPKRKPNSWYPEFMTILYENNYDDLVGEVDIDIYKDLQKKHGHQSLGSCEDPGMEKNVIKMDCKDDEWSVKEAYMSVTEKPPRSTNNLSSPQGPVKDEIDDLSNYILRDIESIDGNNLDDMDETKEKTLATPKVDTELIKSLQKVNFNDDISMKTDSGQEEPDSMMLEDLERELAISVSKDPEMKRRNIVSTPYDEMSSDSDSNDEGIEKKELHLRAYQDELADPALRRKNCIIVAPTGSGKTVVGFKIIKVHCEEMKSKGLIYKVVFMVEQQALAEQQALGCKQYLSQYRVKLITGEVQRDDKLPRPLSSWLKRRDIIVITAESLVNALKKNDVKIEDFSLLMFDECHHAHAKHSYARIMQYYMDRKLDANFPKEKLPKVVGLTASVGAGKSSKMSGAKDHIKVAMANLDAEELVTVKKNKAELTEHIVVPEKNIIRTPARIKDHFGRVLTVLMNTTEKYMRESKHSDKLENKESVLKPPTDKGSDAYTQWISRLRRDTAVIRDPDARRYLITCRNYLDIYNRALIIYEDARVKDAMDFLEEELGHINYDIKKDETDLKLMSLFERSKELLNKFVTNPDHVNPKLEKLKDEIFKMCKEKRDSRIINFVKTRDLADAIVNWMKDTEGLKELNPVKFVGSQAAGTQGGITKKLQNDILKLFKDGGHQIVNATSVAEEGLDIPTCNLVIRYDHVTNETAMVQSRGRARAEDCKFIIIASDKKGTADKEEINELREETMNKAIEEIQQEIAGDKVQFLKDLVELQRAAKKKRDLEALSMNNGIKDSELELRCGKCSDYICMSSDIRKIQDAHHAIVNDEVMQHVTFSRSHPKRIDANLTVNAGRAKCSGCGTALGQIMIHKGAQFVVFKIENFIVTDNAGKNSFYKKWKSVPISPLGLSEDDLERRLQGPKYVTI